MTFSEALDRIRTGQKLAREGWNGKGMFIFFVQGSTFEVNREPLITHYPLGTVIEYQPHIDMRTANGSIVPWLCSQSDMLSFDWEVVE